MTSSLNNEVDRGGHIGGHRGGQRGAREVDASEHSSTGLPQYNQL